MLPTSPTYLSPAEPKGAQWLPNLSRPQECCRLAADPELWVLCPGRGSGPGPSQCGCAFAPAPEPSDPQGRECLRLLQQLHRSFQQLWEVTEESLHSLRERLCPLDSTGLESLLLLRSADHVVQVHVE